MLNWFKGTIAVELNDYYHTGFPSIFFVINAFYSNVLPTSGGLKSVFSLLRLMYI